MSLSRCPLAAAAGLLSILAAFGAFTPRAAAQPKPEGEMRWAIYVTVAPQWFDPAEVQGQINAFWMLYPMHDALVKQMPGNLMTPRLAESWTERADQRVYEIKMSTRIILHTIDTFNSM